MPRSARTLFDFPPSRLSRIDLVELFTGAIDTVLQKNFNVIPSYWEGIIGGQIDDTAAWNTMWNTVITKYDSDGNVYFEPANEPYGYNTADWSNIAAGWLQQHSNAPQRRAN